MVHSVKKGKQNKIHTNFWKGSNHVARFPGQVLKPKNMNNNLKKSYVDRGPIRTDQVWKYFCPMWRLTKALEETP